MYLHFAFFGDLFIIRDQSVLYSQDIHDDCGTVSVAGGGEGRGKKTAKGPIVLGRRMRVPYDSYDTKLGKTRKERVLEATRFNQRYQPYDEYLKYLSNAPKVVIMVA